MTNNQQQIPAIRFNGFTDTWEQRKLEDLAESFNYGLNASAMEFDGENKYIRITDIDEQSHKFIQSGLTSPNIDLLNADDYLLKEGDILLLEQVQVWVRAISTNLWMGKYILLDS